MLSRHWPPTITEKHRTRAKWLARVIFGGISKGPNIPFAFHDVSFHDERKTLLFGFRIVTESTQVFVPFVGFDMKVPVVLSMPLEDWKISPSLKALHQPAFYFLCRFTNDWYPRWNHPEKCSFGR